MQSGPFTLEETAESLDTILNDIKHCVDNNLAVQSELDDLFGRKYTVVISRFYQQWGSTALGLGGIGGSAMTGAMTTVVVLERIDTAFVYFGSSFAYRLEGLRWEFREALKHEAMPPRREANCLARFIDFSAS